MSNVGGLGDDAPDGWVLERFEIPLPRGRRAIVEAFDSVLRQPKVQSVMVELGKPIVFSRFVKEAEASQSQHQETQMSLGELARNVHMEEYEPKLEDGSKETFINMLMAVAARRLHLTHIGVGVDTVFFDWLHLDRIMFGGIANIGGVELVRDRDIPNDNMIFFAGHRKAGRVDEATYALKCHLLVHEFGGTHEQGTAGQDLGGRDRTEERGQPDGAVADDAGGQRGEGGGVRPEEGQGAS